MHSFEGWGKAACLRLKFATYCIVMRGGGKAQHDAFVVLAPQACLMRFAISSTFFRNRCRTQGERAAVDHCHSQGGQGRLRHHCSVRHGSVDPALMNMYLMSRSGCNSQPAARCKAPAAANRHATQYIICSHRAGFPLFVVTQLKGVGVRIHAVWTDVLRLPLTTPG